VVFLRKVRTASGATAVQIAERVGGRDKVIEHLGSAHSEAELAVLMQAGRQKMHEGQGELDLGLGERGSREAVVVGQRSRVLIEVVEGAWRQLGFDVVGDEAFFQLVLARLVEPTSKADSVRVLTELGCGCGAPQHVHRDVEAVWAARIPRPDRGRLLHPGLPPAGDVSLVLYDVTTLYFEAEQEDGLRKVGYSKERRVDPQVIVGLLVDRQGFPLEIGCWEDNKAETTTIIPIIRQFQERHALSDMVVVADAGMLSASNLKDLDEAGLRFIVGSRVTKAPTDLASHFHWHGDAFTDGHIVDTITPRVATAAARGVNDVAKRAEPVWDPTVHPKSWRAVWAYSAKRAARDGKTLTLQENRAKAVVAGEKAARTPRFVTVKNGSRVLDEASLTRARRWSG
jgi:hypothetical protein